MNFIKLTFSVTTIGLLAKFEWFNKARWDLFKPKKIIFVKKTYIFIIYFVY